MTHSLERMYIAQDKRSSMHSLIRFVEAGELNSPREKVDFESANALLMARDPESLVESALKLGPMFVRETDLGDRRLALSQIDGAARKRFRQSDSTELLAECFFDRYTSSIGGGSVMFEGQSPSCECGSRRGKVRLHQRLSRFQFSR